MINEILAVVILLLIILIILAWARNEINKNNGFRKK